MFEFITNLFSGTKSPEVVAAEQKLKEAEQQLKEAQANPTADQPATGQPPTTQAGGGRRRKSAKKSNKRRRPAKKSLFNITKKWNPFAK
jgi:hypothetical protein